MVEINRHRESFYLHRMQAINDSGRIKLEKIAEEPNGGKIQSGIHYRLHVVPMDETSAALMGWSTGNMQGGDDGASWRTTAKGVVYAPQGFIAGNHAYVSCNDSHMRITREGLKGIKEFVESVGSSEQIGELIDELQGFTIMGEIMGEKGRRVITRYELPKELRGKKNPWWVGNIEP